MLMAATIVFGGVAPSRIAISQFPDVDSSTISVSVTWEGGAPDVMEHDVVEPLEEAVMQVAGVTSFTSSSRQGSADVTTVPGVGEVAMGGDLDRNARIWVDADEPNAKAPTVTDVIAALQREHAELPAGRFETEGREISVRVMSEALDLTTLRRIVPSDRAGAPVYLSDVALVADGFEDERRIARVNGAPAIGLGIHKQRGANAVAQGVKAAQKTLPAGPEAGVSFDSTTFIEDSVHEIQLEILLSIVLTELVCWMSLGSLSSTPNVVLEIPMSLLGTIAFISFAGFTLNTFTLLAPGLAVGVVVDDAIMVMENVFRHLEEGKDRATGRARSRSRPSRPRSRSSRSSFPSSS